MDDNDIAHAGDRLARLHFLPIPSRSSATSFRVNRK